MIGTLAAIVVALVLMSAAISAAEAATFSVGRSRLQTLLDEGFHGSEALHSLRSRPAPVRAAVHLLVIILNLVAVGLTVLLGYELGGARAALAGLALGAVVVLVLAEIGPRALASRHPIRLALSSAPILLSVERWVRVGLSPFLRLETVLAGRGDEDDVTEEEREFLQVSELGQEEGVVDPDEHILVQRAFRLDELTAFDVMTPRVDIFAWKDDLHLEEIIGELADVPYSRVPVYGDTIDDITGILYVREAYESFVGGGGTRPLSAVCRDPFFVPGSLSLAQLLRDFQARRIHMGIVADEYGGTDGLVTLEDVLEELVGEIVDETDVEGEPLMRISRNELVADGTVDLREINHSFNVSLPQLEHRSLNGYILEEMGYVPQEGESIRRGRLRIDILEASDTQVVRARLRRLDDDEASGNGE
ncbi:MAG: hemolysin family protein [Gemmatimonadota bacterium]|jgi:CBS domain containing-hemolysin-like protein